MSSLILTPTMGDVQISVAAQVREERDLLLVEASLISSVEDRLDADDATQILRKLSDFARLIETQRKAAKEPVLELGRKIDALGKELAAKVDEEKGRISRLVGAFEAEERRKAEDERRRLEAEQIRLAAEAERKIREAAKQAKTEEQRDRAVDRVIEEAHAKTAAIQQQIASAQPRKAEGSKLTTVVLFEVTDIRALYAAHPELVVLEPNGTAIRSILKANPNLQVPGLRHWTEQKLSIS